MPFYSFACECGHTEEVFRPVQDHALGLTCPECGEEMHKDYRAMIPAYHDVPFDSVDTDITGEPFVYHTRGQLREHAKRHHLEVEFGTSHRNHGEL